MLPRTRWVDELVHRYLFERDVCARHGSLATRFLETELIKELYFLADEQRAGRARAPVVGEGSALVERARAAIEASLFAPFAMAALARACHASESSLTRAFKQALGITPGAYVRERRLDEAMPLLESGRYSVGEVAARVGYARQAAFAAAFQRKFHVAPSSVRLPVDPLTCELDPERWQRWLAWDPLRMVDACAANLRTLRGLYIDCGRRDQYNLVYGARQLHRALDRLAVPHRYDEFDDDHTAIDYRMDDSLPFLARALA